MSCTTTLNNSYGSAVTVTGAGFLLNDEMDDFATAPGKPNMYGLVQGEANAIAPGKRMLSAMTPSIVLDPEGQLLLVVGTPGGPRIITMVYHVISNVIDHRMTLADAVAPRGCTTRRCPTLSRSSAAAFRPRRSTACGPAATRSARRGYWGDVEAIIRTPDGLAGGERSAAGWEGARGTESADGQATGGEQKRSGRWQTSCPLLRFTLTRLTLASFRPQLVVQRQCHRRARRAPPRRGPWSRPRAGCPPRRR